MKPYKIIKSNNNFKIEIEAKLSNFNLIFQIFIISIITIGIYRYIYSWITNRTEINSTILNLILLVMLILILLDIILSFLWQFLGYEIVILKDNCLYINKELLWLRISKHYRIDKIVKIKHIIDYNKKYLPYSYFVNILTKNHGYIKFEYFDFNHNNLFIGSSLNRIDSLIIFNELKSFVEKNYNFIEVEYC
jgi:hypothetical protein